MNNSGSEDLWLSATGAVVNGGRWPRGIETSLEAFCSRVRFGTSLKHSVPLISFYAYAAHESRDVAAGYAGDGITGGG
jgi:hypothetical protein